MALFVLIRISFIRILSLKVAKNIRTNKRALNPLRNKTVIYSDMLKRLIIVKKLDTIK